MPKRIEQRLCNARETRRGGGRLRGSFKKLFLPPLSWWDGVVALAAAAAAINSSSKQQQQQQQLSLSSSSSTNTHVL